MNLFIEDTIQGINANEEKSNLQNCLNWLKNLSNHHDSEIKIYNTDIKEYLVSFNWKGINQWKIDCPVELNKIHRQRYATKEECALFIKKLYQQKDLDNEKGFIDVPIRHFTLDEMLQFKKEDEMMLRGQDPDANNNSTKESSKSKTLSAKKEISKESNTATPTPSKSQKTPSKPIQQIKSTVTKEATPNKIKSITEKALKNKSKSSNDDSFFSI